MSHGSKVDDAVEAAKTESKAATVARAIRKGILDGTYSEGESLRQRDIARSLGVSATPVREAFSQLQAEGYLVARLNAGSVVRQLGDRMAENWRLRAALEPVGAEAAARLATDDDVERIRRLAKDFENASTDEDAAALNRDFHFAIYELSASPVLIRFLNELWQTLDISPTARRSHAASTAEHSAIVEAIARGDAHAASEYTRLHVSGTAPTDLL